MKRCRILYRCYGSQIWKSREAYQNRIYYESQLEPKMLRPFKYFFCDGKMHELYSKMKRTHYNGKPTKLKQQIDALSQKMDDAMVHYDRFERLLTFGK